MSPSPIHDGRLGGGGTSLVQVDINALEALEHMATLGKYSTTKIHGQTLSNFFLSESGAQ